MSRCRHSVIMPTLGNHPTLFAAIESILPTLGRDDELIVVYNGPAHRFPEALRSVASSRALRLTATATPYGIAKANNHGYRQSAGDYLVFVHDDVVIRQRDWLDVLSGALERHPAVGLLGGSEDKYIDRSRETTPTLPSGIKICDWSPTISMARREQIAPDGLFDEFYLVGLEDKDWALSFRRRNLLVGCSPVDHEHLGTTGSYSAFLEDKGLLDYYTREGVRERHFLRKNQDVLDAACVAAGLRKWGSRDRNWRKSWWLKLYLKYYWRALTLPGLSRRDKKNRP